MRFIFFFTHIRFHGVQPGQYKSRFGPRSRILFFFLTELSLFIVEIVAVPKVPERNFSFYIFFDTSEQKKKIVARTFQTSATSKILQFGAI